MRGELGLKHLAALLCGGALTLLQATGRVAAQDEMPPPPASPSFHSGPAGGKQSDVPRVRLDVEFLDSEAAPYGLPPGIDRNPAGALAPTNQTEPKAEDQKEPKRRALPSPWDSPPFPGSEYQGYPIIGVPPDTTEWPLMKALQGTWEGDILNSEKIRAYGWVTAEANWSTSRNSNTPDSYWIRPNKLDVDQALIRLERNLDSVQTDHIDWGFRSTVFYGIDYRYTTGGGWFSDQLLNHNSLYGVDPTEQYVDVYVPWVAQGMIVRVGRWIACPDIETQFAPDNYMGSHSLLFTFDTYTQTGVMLTFKLDDQWTAQAAIHAGTDMAPWYKGAIPTGAFGLRWVSKSNNDAFYTWLNAINDAKFRRFDENGQPAGHDNFNYLVTTWEHRFNKMINTKTESYIMWQRDAVVGGTPSIGPVEPFGGGGGIGANIPGTTLTYGVLNYTLIAFSKRDFITIRNEWWKDEDGERSGFPSTYTSDAIGLSHNFTPDLQIRPEIGYYRSWTTPAFDNGTKRNQFMAGFDVTLRF
jgi:Putative beta-barrel porin-2, OmpL-like. bbp2